MKKPFFSRFFRYHFWLFCIKIRDKIAPKLTFLLFAITRVESNQREWISLGKFAHFLAWTTTWRNISFRAQYLQKAVLFDIVPCGVRKRKSRATQARVQWCQRSLLGQNSSNPSKSDHGKYCSFVLMTKNTEFYSMIRHYGDEYSHGLFSAENYAVVFVEWSFTGSPSRAINISQQYVVRLVSRGWWFHRKDRNLICWRGPVSLIEWSIQQENVEENHRKRRLKEIYRQQVRYHLFLSLVILFLPWSTMKSNRTETKNEGREEKQIIFSKRTHTKEKVRSVKEWNRIVVHSS